MGTQRIYSPEHLRKRAEEFRPKAETQEGRFTQDILFRAADLYDELARRAEQIRTLGDLE